MPSLQDLHLLNLNQRHLEYFHAKFTRVTFIKFKSTFGVFS